jgi:hypothetical protein
VRFLLWLEAAVDIAALRAAGPSPEMALLLALIIYDGYELFPASPAQMALPFESASPES